MTTTCDLCGHELEIGDYPFCRGDASKHVPSKPGVIPDDIPGGVEIRHGLCNEDGTPRRYYSYSSMREEAKRRGLENIVRHVGEPGSDKAKHTTRWV